MPLLQPHIPDFPSGTTLVGRTVLITGASPGGIGYAAALQYLQLNASKLIITARDISRGEKAKKSLLAHPSLKEASSSLSIEVMVLDLNSFTSVRQFADSVKKKYDYLDNIVLNAGMNIPEWKITEDGHEANVQTNYISNAFLSLLLLPLLRNCTKQQHPAYLTIVGSQFERRAAVAKMATLDDVKEPLVYFQNRKSASIMRYADTKLLVSMFIRQLAQHMGLDSGVIVDVMCPGMVVPTGFEGPLPFLFRWIMYCVKSFFGRPLVEAGRAVVFASAIVEAHAHGEFIVNNKVQPIMPFAITDKGKLLKSSLWRDTLDLLKVEVPGWTDDSIIT
ncbi:putative carbonyl reductase [Flagelloscypha sp. PMI_526]|nr:putative carbonyl reductase [Flagelloscypha sp. PMI_526]